MADFDPPFAWDGERRVPTADEIETGFGCGPFALPLWNWMFYAIWSEIGEVLTFNGITPDNGDMTQLRQAIQAQIDAATGGGDPESYLTLLQASARLPIFPEVLNTPAHFGVVSPGTGQVRVPAGVNFQHRGISPYTTVQTDLATDASKTYHLRWNKTDGFTLKDLATGGYNPGTLAETDASFDSTFDDMLVARIITNSSNVPSITNLANKTTLKQSYERTASIYGPRTSPGFEAATLESFTINMARTPEFFLRGFSESPISPPTTDGSETNVLPVSINRYTATIYAMSFNAPTDVGGRPQYSASFIAIGG